MNKKSLFLVLIVILTVSLSFILWELPAQAGRYDNPALQKEPSSQIKQLYEELKLKIRQLKKEAELPPDLANIQEQINQISLKLKAIQPKMEPETADSRSEIELNPESRALIDQKRKLQTKFHTAIAPLEILRAELAGLLIKKEKLESEYFLIPVEIPILTKTAPELHQSKIIIEGELKLKPSDDDINITLVLSRAVAASAFCEVYFNNSLVKRERWKIGSKGEFTATIEAADKTLPQQVRNNLMIILNTSYQEDDIVIESPSFEKNPLSIFSESTIAARNLVTGSFELRQKAQEKDPGLGES